MNRNNRVLQNKCLELNFRETDQLFSTLASPQTSFGVRLSRPKNTTAKRNAHEHKI